MSPIVAERRARALRTRTLRSPGVLSHQQSGHRRVSGRGDPGAVRRGCSRFAQRVRGRRNFGTVWAHSVMSPNLCVERNSSSGTTALRALPPRFSASTRRRCACCANRRVGGRPRGTRLSQIPKQHLDFLSLALRDGVCGYCETVLSRARPVPLAGVKHRCFVAARLSQRSNMERCAEPSETSQQAD
jgi:hypothetical protein